MKFPSIATLRGELLKTLRRWPLTILLAVVGTWLLMWTTDSNYEFRYDRHDHLWRMIYGCYLTMLLTIAATVFAEVKGLRIVFKVCLLVLALLLGFVIYFTLPEASSPRFIRILILGLAIHWLIAVIPYARPDSGPNGFWDYNRKLFLRSLQTMLYTGTLYLGATLALLAIDHLFGVDVNTRVYENVWWFLACTFSTVFFLAGFPRVFVQPESIDDYPRGLKVFTQFVLLPLVTIYLVILYAYLFKIIFTAHWPSGWVSWLVLGFAVAGIFALLLIYPLRKEEANLWINSYARFFYLALFPLIVLLWIAIWKRIQAYGVTEWRYYVMVLGIWLAVMAGYFVFSVRKDIRLIPASLCLLALLTLWGPWSASVVSLDAQRGRLQGILEKNGLFAGGKVQRAKADPSLEDRKAISSIVSYLIDMHGIRVLQPWFVNNLDSLKHDSQVLGYGEMQDWQKPRAVLALMNVSYADKYETIVTARWINCNVVEDWHAIKVDSASFVIPVFAMDGLMTEGRVEKQYFLERDTALIGLDTIRHQLNVSISRRNPVVAFDLRPLEQLLSDSDWQDQNIQLPPAKMTLRAGGNAVFLTTVRATRNANGVHIDYAMGALVLTSTQFGDSSHGLKNRVPSY